MMRRVAVPASLALAALAVLAAPTALLAQIRGGRPPSLPRPQVQRDTARRDTTAADSAASARLRLSPPDSVMEALLRKRGFSVTRYEGARVTFDAENNLFQIIAGEDRRALVQRNDSQTVYADTGIFFNQKTKLAIASGSTIVLHDPSGGVADVVGRGQLTYSLAERSATISNPRFSSNATGQEWDIRADRGKLVLGDSATGKSTAFYGLGGELTSCTDSVPDYRFKFDEVKRSGSNTLVARPAVLYIRDIPVLWLPFLFSDMRPGRHSGILTPRFGISDIIRSNAGYRRNVENLGYYYVFGDYMDASAWLDWRSSAGATEGDPGYLKYNGEWRYAWLDRQLSGNLASSYTRQRDGFTNLAVTWGHRQSFTRDRSFNASVNYVTSTRLQRQNTFNPFAAVGTIASSLTYNDKIGPAQLSLGGTRRQYPGREQIEQTFPTLSLTASTINLASWLQWTPSLNVQSNQTLHIDTPDEFAYRSVANPVTGRIDSVRANRNQYSNSGSFDTPFRIFGYDLRNAFRVSEQSYNYPKRQTIIDPVTGANLGDRIFSNFFVSELDWTPEFQLPAVARSLFNITPSISLGNATSGSFWVRSNLSGGEWVHQSKRPSFSLAASPAIYGLLPGFGPFTRLRHTIQPSISYSYAPRADVSVDYLRALGRSKANEFAGLQSNTVSLGLNQTFEAKVRSRSDSTEEGGEKITLLSLETSSFQYDVDRARATHKSIRGLNTSDFNYSIHSDLLPGFNFSSTYSLFAGDPKSDSARFSPYLTNVSASLQFSKGSNPFVVLNRLFGKAVPSDQRPDPTGLAAVGPARDESTTRQLASQPVAGSGARGSSYVIPPSHSWSASFNFTSSQSRPVTGGNVVEIDPRTRCQQLAQLTGNPFVFDTCLAQALSQSGSNAGDSLSNIISGATVYRSPPQRSLGVDLKFGITKNWAGSWNTSYDFVRHEFAQHYVALQRDLHDWTANFGFTQTASGNFAFNVFISLKAEPDLKFPYNKTTIRTP